MKEKSIESSETYVVLNILECFFAQKFVPENIEVTGSTIKRGGW